MSPAVFLTEIALFIAVLCGLHALKPRFGLAPLYVAIGLVETFLWVAGKQHPDGHRIMTALYFAPPAFISYLLFLPMLLGSMVLVYVLEGTAEARRLLVAVVLLYVLHGVVEEVIALHAAHPPLGHPDLSGSVLVYRNLAARLAAIGALVVDVFVIIAGYQLMVNRLPRVPLVVPLFASLVAAMVSDAIVYSLLRGRSFGLAELTVVEKLQAGVAAGIPLAAYLGWQLRRHGSEVRRGILERGALAIVDLRRRVERIEAMYLHVKQTFGRYVSADVVESLLADPSRVRLGGETRRVTILFADIRGYSTLAESLPPDVLITLLNGYFQCVTGVILDARGMINEFEGDAVLAVFGAPNDLPDHADRAVRAALGMLDAVAALNREWDADGTSETWRNAGVDGLAIRIGVHTGPVVAGNIGTETRTKYAVIGDTVNTASRVEGLNKALGTWLLVTEATREAVTGADVTFADLGSHSVKGRNEPVRVYAVDYRK